MKIGNIIYEDDLVNHTKVDYINYYKSGMVVDYDHSLPTLYVGWSYMKEVYSDNETLQNADILKHKIVTNELYWEFTFSESKSSHIKGVESFVNYVPEFYFSRYFYTDVDPVLFQLRDVQDLMDVLPKKIDTFYSYKNEMIYLLVNDKISGINIVMYKFFKFDIEEIYNTLICRAQGQSISDANGEIYQKHYKQFPNFTHLKRYLIVLLTK